MDHRRWIGHIKANMLPHLTETQWLLAVICGLLIGMTKTGFSGASLFIIPLFVGIFGAKASVGVVLPMFIVADVFAVKHYHRHANWKVIFKLLPPAMVGILIALFVGELIDDEQFQHLIALILLSLIGFTILLDFSKVDFTLPDIWWITLLLGLIGGFTSMIGNAAGPILSLYLISLHLPKNIMIATGAWFFFIVNVAKMPLHVFVWNTIHVESLVFNTVMILPILAGAVLGVYLIKIIPGKMYRWFILISTAVSSIALL